MKRSKKEQERYLTALGKRRNSKSVARRNKYSSQTVSSLAEQAMSAIGKHYKTDQLIAHIADCRHTSVPLPSSGKVETKRTLKIPRRFSLVHNEKKSFKVIHQLFDILYSEGCRDLIIDFSRCNDIDLGAEIYLDAILKNFIRQYEQNSSARAPSITYKEPSGSVKELLKSIGPYQYVLGLNSEFDGVLTCPLCEYSHQDGVEGHEKSVNDLTQYVLSCVTRMGRQLSPLAEKSLCRVIGEIMSNANEHSSIKRRYSVGYFTDKSDAARRKAVFKLAIMNVGDTIYEKFKSPQCPAIETVNKMEELTSHYKDSGFFRKNLTEESLWTLYALQDNVTSTGEPRGNGSIRFIDHFYKLNSNFDDDESWMALISGKARIYFDGRHKVISGTKPQGKSLTSITFNGQESLQYPPDNKNVKSSNLYFPGTLLQASIVFDHTDFVEHEKRNNRS